MSHKSKINKGQEYRPRLHDGSPEISRMEKFVILRFNNAKDGKYFEEQFKERGLFIRPDSGKGPVRVL